MLSAGGSYRLLGTIRPNSPGTYRIRLDYFTRMDDPSAPSFSEYSATFVVR